MPVIQNYKFVLESGFFSSKKSKILAIDGTAATPGN